MKHYLTKHRYGYGKNELSIDPETLAVEAISYGWWRFVKTDSVGNVFFNMYYYSSTTRKHQYAVSRILKRIGIKVNVVFERLAHDIGSDIKESIWEEINEIKREIRELNDAIGRKYTKKAKNAERLEQIKQREYRIKDLTRWRDEYVDQKKIPTTEHGSERWWWSDSRVDQVAPRFEALFLKPNGVLQRNEFQAFKREMTGSARNFDRDITPITKHSAVSQLLGLNIDQVRLLNLYQYCVDLNGMIPADDTAEYLAVKKWTEKNIKKISLYAFDCLHTYLTNMQNRREYVAKEPLMFPVAPEIIKVKKILENEEMKVEIIDTDRKLRSEGKRQSHCIGGEHYQRMIQQGYQAMHVDGYTFFINPDLTIRETKGKYNQYTPNEVFIAVDNALMAVKRGAV